MTINQHVINNRVIYLHSRGNNHHIDEFVISMEVNETLKKYWHKGVHFLHGLSSHAAKKEILRQIPQITDTNPSSTFPALDVLREILDCSEKNPNCFWYVY